MGVKDGILGMKAGSTSKTGLPIGCLVTFGCQ